MGICKCKKRTDLFCFVHKKAVCENCIVEDHQTCIIKTYVDWLTDSDYDRPACGICKGELKEDKLIRLTCFDLFHPECIDVHASSLPPHTAKAGYLCPVCSKPLFPPDVDNNPLVKQLNNYLARASWAKTLLAPTPDTINQHDNMKDTDSSLAALEGGLTVPSKRSNETAQENSLLGIASRKQPKDTMMISTDEDEEDKYQKRSLTQLFVALGLLRPSKNKPRTRIRLDKRRILIILALITCLVTVIALGMSLTSDINNVEEQTLDV